MRGNVPTRATLLMRIVVLLGCWNMACMAFAAPSITSVTADPDPLSVGGDFTIYVEGQNIATGVVYVDFRPAVARMLRLNLAADGNRWSVKGTIPADLGLTSDAQVTVRVFAFDAAGARAERTVLFGLKNRPPFTIQFDQAAYSVVPATPFTARVIINGTTLPKLFSYALEVNLVSASISGNGITISVPAALNYNGPRAGTALVASAANKGLAKGTVNFFATPPVYYSESLLATINFSGLPAGSYTLTVKGYPTLGATEALFVDDNPKILDPSVTYGTATVTVAPAAPAPADVVVASAPAANPSPSPTPVIPAPAAGGSVQNPAKTAAPRIASAPGAVALTFEGVPGECYFVQHSSDLQTWTTALPMIVGNGASIQWADQGPPETASAPDTAPQRFYRVLKVTASQPKEGQ